MTAGIYSGGILATARMKRCCSVSAWPMAEERTAVIASSSAVAENISPSPVRSQSSLMPNFRHTSLMNVSSGVERPDSRFEIESLDIEGLCASAATFFLCVPGAHVRIASGSEVMIHNPSCMEWGTAEDLEKTARRMRAMEKEQHGWYAARTGKTEEEIKAMMDATTWMTASEAVKQGFCDEVMETAEAAACLDADSWALMRECYEKVPEAPKKQVSTGKPAEHTKEGLEGKNMDIENMTAEQLKEQAPRLYEAAMQEGREAGIAAERDRMQAIDELTDEGYEGLAQKAKNEGWTESAFLKELRKAKADRKKEFLKEREGETGAAEQVLGGSQGDQDGNAEEEMKKFRKEAKEMAEELTGASSGGMF